jgi:hypothetical protein
MSRRLAEHRFTFLLAALTLLLLVTPAVYQLSARGHGTWGLGLTTLIFAFVLAATVPAISRSRKQTVLLVMLAGASILLRALSMLPECDEWETAHLVSSTLFLVFVIVLILKRLFEIGRVSLHAISASLCAYMLLGVLWTNVYALIARFDPAAFSSPSGLPTALETKEQRVELFIEMLYFSFTTLTTLGYGDVTPTTAFARMFAVTEAIVGQIILVVLVARLVGLHVAHSADGRS